MLALRVCAVLTLCCSAASAAPVSVDVSSACVLGEELTLRCDLRVPDYRFAMAGSWPGGGSFPRLLAGVSSSWLRIGPLSPAGALREASHPLGFQAGSDVFVQRTGFVLDTSFPAQPSGILLMPLPRTLGVFARELSTGGEWVGCMASVLQIPGLGLEGFVSLSGPPRGSMGEEWITESAPFAGGRILSGAARLLADCPPFGMTATFGVSRGEMSLPGSFIHVHLAARTGALSFFLLLARADGTCTSPSGDHPPEESLVSTAFQVADAGGEVDVRISHAICQPSFAPGLFRAGRTEASLAAEKSMAAGNQALVSVRAEGSRIIHEETDGGQGSASRCAATTAVRVSPVRLESGVACSQDEGVSARFMAEAVLDHHGSLASFEGTASHLDGGEQDFSALCSLRLGRKSFRVTVGAGLTDVRFRAVGEDFLEGLKLSILWDSRSQ